MPTASTLIAKAGANKYMRKALTSWPDYERLVALRAEVSQRQRTLAPAPQALPPATADADFDTWLRDVTRAANAQRDRELQHGALGDLLRDVDAEILGIVEVHTETLLKSLASDLADLTAATKDVVDRLDGAATPAAAIANGTPDAWRELPSLRCEYDSLRDAQMAVMTAADPVHVQNARSQHFDDDLASDLMIANLDTILPGWRSPAPAHFAMSGAAPDRRPWPTNPIEQLVWLTASNAQPWVPTLAQLYRLQDGRRAKDNPSPSTRPGDIRAVGLLNKPLAQAAARA